MQDWRFYRLALPFVPVRGRLNAATLSPAISKELERILRRYRCVGASLSLFDERGAIGGLAFGSARRDMAAGLDTVYRAASVSKLATALGAMRLQEQGRVALDADVNRYLPFSLRHPAAPDTPITLRMLLSHTAGIHDGVAYNAGIGQGETLEAILRGDSFCAHLPGESWEYSNLGAGIAGAVLEAAAGMDFEALMQETVFQPLGIAASFYPQKIASPLADAYRILPPRRGPALDGAKRQARPLPPPEVNAQQHYALAHGNLCLSAPALAKLGAAGMQPGFLTAESLAAMRRPIAGFGARANNLSQGVGTFILQDPSLSPRPLYGHQGMAYGAVHALFFDPAIRRGVALLTSGASEARRGVLADLNAGVIRYLWHTVFNEKGMERSGWIG